MREKTQLFSYHCKLIDPLNKMYYKGGILLWNLKQNYVFIDGFMMIYSIDHKSWIQLDIWNKQDFVYSINKTFAQWLFWTGEDHNDLVTLIDLHWSSQ